MPFIKPLSFIWSPIAWRILTPRGKSHVRGHLLLLGWWVWRNLLPFFLLKALSLPLYGILVGLSVAWVYEPCCPVRVLNSPRHTLGSGGSKWHNVSSFQRLMQMLGQQKLRSYLWNASCVNNVSLDCLAATFGPMWRQPAWKCSHTEKNRSKRERCKEKGRRRDLMMRFAPLDPVMLEAGLPPWTSYFLEHSLHC